MPEPVYDRAAFYNQELLDFIRTIITEDLAEGRNGGRVATRFPPEPYDPATRGGDAPDGRREGGSGAASGRYRVVFTLSVNNLTNHSNFSGFSGVQTSPFFLTPTAVQNPRKVDLGVSIRF